MIPLKEEISIPAPLDRVWPILSDPELVSSCIPGAAFTSRRPDGVYEGTISVKFGPTVARFRGEATVTYDHAARRCTIEGRGLDQRGASRALASGNVVASGADTTLLSIDGGFRVSGPLETFANAGGIHLARALLGEFAGNIARLAVAGQQPAASAAAPAAPEVAGPAVTAAPSPPPMQPAAPVSATRMAWLAARSWFRKLFAGSSKGNSA